MHAAPSAEPPRAFDKGHWPLTLGVIMGVTLFAFENLAVITIAPRIAEALSGTPLYGWIFSGFLLASLLSTVLGGAQADRHGPARPFALGLLLFGAGLLLSGFAPSMLVFLLGRVVQGLGGGMMVTALYATVNLAYPDALRPRVVALMSSAWVLPALLGPALAGLIAEASSWRVVFWGMVPLLLAVLALSLPALRQLEPGPQQRAARRLPAALLLVAGTGGFLVGLGVGNPLLVPPLLVAGGLAAWLGLGRLMPSGTLRLRAGLPAVVAGRGLFFAAFIGVETFLALMLTGVHGFSSSVTGVAIASGAISWTVASWTQDRLDKTRGGGGRPRRVVLGTILLTLGLASQLLALYATVWPLVLVFGGWMLAGFGIGLAHSTSSVLAFAYAPPGKEGEVSASLQLADQFSAAVSTGVGGALLALATGVGWSLQTGILLAFGFALLLELIAMLAATRTAPRRAPS